VVRRMPLVASVGGTLVPALSVELLRLAQGTPMLTLSTDGAAVRGLQVGALAVLTEPDGGVRPWFSRRNSERFVSAVDVMQAKVGQDQLRDRIVIVGLTALALSDFQATPVGERMPGSEIHAQLIENLIDGTLLRRPRWAGAAEAGLLLVLGGLLVWAVPRWRPWKSALLLSALVFGTIGLGVALFHGRRWLVDAASPALGLLALFLALLVMSLAESTRQRRALERVLQAQREEAARVAGEMAAAQRIQCGSLPRVDLLQADPRADLHAVLEPAREVGGDLYDFFRLDERRLFVLVGDGEANEGSVWEAVMVAADRALDNLTVPEMSMAFATAAGDRVMFEGPGGAGLFDVKTRTVKMFSTEKIRDFEISPDGTAMAYATAKATVIVDPEGTEIARMPAGIVGGSPAPMPFSAIRLSVMGSFSDIARIAPRSNTLSTLSKPPGTSVLTGQAATFTSSRVSNAPSAMGRAATTTGVVSVLACLGIF